MDTEISNVEDSIDALKALRIQQRDFYNKRQRDYYNIRKTKKIKVIDTLNQKKVGRPMKVKTDEPIIKRPRGRPLREIV